MVPSQTVQAEDFTMPPVTICMQNGLKLRVLQKQGLKSTSDYLSEDGKIQNVSSVWDTFLDAAYLLNRDFMIAAFETPLNLGKNVIENGIVDIREYHTLISGTCYGIKSNIAIPKPKIGLLDLRFNKSLDKRDFPEVKPTNFKF